MSTNNLSRYDLLQKIYDNIDALNQLAARSDLTQKILADVVRRVTTPKRQFIQLVDTDGNLLWINQSDIIQAYTRPALKRDDETIDRPAKLYLMIREVYGSDGANSLALDFDLVSPQAHALMDWLDQNGQILYVPDQEEEEK